MAACICLAVGSIAGGAGEGDGDAVAGGSAAIDCSMSRPYSILEHEED
ncbi:hypothetical protein [Nannocystis pusilla]